MAWSRVSKAAESSQLAPEQCSSPQSMSSLEQYCFFQPRVQASPILGCNHYIHNEFWRITFTFVHCVTFDPPSPLRPHNEFQDCYHHIQGSACPTSILSCCPYFTVYADTTVFFFLVAVFRLLTYLILIARSDVTEVDWRNPYCYFLLG